MTALLMALVVLAIPFLVVTALIMLERNRQN